MSKNSSSSVPSYKPTSGSFSISGGPSASYNKGNSSFKLNDIQQQAYDYAQSEFANNLASLNVFSPETMNQINSEVDAYKQKILKELDSIYTPMVQQTTNDAARRFGNLDNSVFLNNLNSVEDQRAQAAANAAENIAAKQSSLIAQELQNRYNYLNFLNSYQNQIFNNALNAAGQANSSANMLSNQYQTAYANYANSQNNNFDIGKVATLVGQAGAIAGLLL